MADSQEDRITSESRAAAAFRNALSDIPPHNALINAYHDADMYSFVPPDRLMWRVPAVAIPARVRRNVDADLIVAGIKQQLIVAREVIEQRQSVLDRDTQSVIHSTPDRPYSPLHASVVVTRRITPGYASAWNYDFNPYRLAVTMLDEYEQLIETVMKRRLAPFTQLSRIFEKAKFLENSVGLVDHAMWLASL